jgi:hypothetical protein
VAEGAVVHLAVFLHKRVLERREQVGRWLVAPVGFLLAQDAEDVHVLEGLGLGPSLVRPGQEIAFDVELRFHVIPDLGVAARGVGLLLVAQLQPAAELLECVGHADHFFLQ